MIEGSCILSVRTPKGEGFEFRVLIVPEIKEIEFELEIKNEDGYFACNFNNDPDNLIKNARKIFMNANVFTKETDAIEESYRLAHENNTKHGICYLDIDREF